MITWRGRPFTAPCHRLALAIPNLHPAIKPPIDKRIRHVFDGDCFSITRNRKTLFVRIWGADAPECPQPYGLDAKRALIALLARHDVSLQLISTDQFHRKICRVSTSECPDVSLELIRRGLAWHDKRFAPHAAAYSKAEAAARKAKLGLWSDPNPMPPWIWRRTHNTAVPNIETPPA